MYRRRLHRYQAVAGLGTTVAGGIGSAAIYRYASRNQDE